jgi:hypothetical protein
MATRLYPEMKIGLEISFWGDRIDATWDISEITYSHLKNEYGAYVSGKIGGYALYTIYPRHLENWYEEMERLLHLHIGRYQEGLKLGHWPKPEPILHFYIPLKGEYMEVSVI